MIYGTGLPLSNLTLKYGKSPDLSIDVLFFPGACSVAMSNCHLKGLAWPPLDTDGPGEPTHFNLSSPKIRIT